MSEQRKPTGTTNASVLVLAGAILALAVVLWLVFGGAFSEDEPDISVTVPGVGTVEGSVDTDG